MASRVFLSAAWEHLAMFNYEVDASILQKHLPPYTEIDMWEGKAIVSVVGFMFRDTKVVGVKWPGFTTFEEVNLRFYVKYFDGTEWRRGVTFVSEIVPQALIARMANTLYNEHYSVAAMSHDIAVKDGTLRVAYKWQQKGNRQNAMFVHASSRPHEILPGSEEEFIFEHYYGYNQLNRLTTIEYTVRHPRWLVFPVIDSGLHCDVAQLYGSEFEPFITGVQPRSVFLAKGSEVQVKTPRRIRGFAAGKKL